MNSLKKIGNEKGMIDAYAEALISNVRMAVLDTQGMILWVNERFCRLTQYSEMELVGKSITVLNCLEPHVFSSVFGSIAAHKKWSGEIRTQAKDGSFFWFKTTVLPVTTGDKESFLVLNTNITPTKTAQQEKNDALKNFSLSIARYQALMEVQPDLISLCRADGTRVFANHSYCRFFRMELHELIGTNIIDLPIKGIPIDVVEDIRHLTLENPKVSSIYEVENADGEKRWMSFCVKGIFDNEGNLYEFLTVGRNVSELKNAEVRKSVYIEALEKIAHMTSHNVRAPIATMMGLIELMRINAVHSDQWNMVMDSFKKCIVDLDNYSKELGTFVNQRQL
jgi:PAS domain S-box-containing protein